MTTPTPTQRKNMHRPPLTLAEIKQARIDRRTMTYDTLCAKYRVTASCLKAYVGDVVRDPSGRFYEPRLEYIHNEFPRGRGG